MISYQAFLPLAIKVIDNLEGGYYHPNMLQDGRITDQRYATSGETLYGLDRKNGTSLFKFPAWTKFWNAVDASNARNTWKWNSLGPTDIKNKLEPLAAEIMYGGYNDYASQYLTAPARTIVESDQRILFNFIYASWNGPGFFKKYATMINTAVAKGNKNTDSLLKILIDARTNDSNSLIRQTGEKIKDLVQSLPAAITQAVSENKGKIGIALLLAAAATAGVYAYKKR